MNHDVHCLKSFVFLSITHSTNTLGEQVSKPKPSSKHLCYVARTDLKLHQRLTESQRIKSDLLLVKLKFMNE